MCYLYKMTDESPNIAEDSSEPGHRTEKNQVFSFF